MIYLAGPISGLSWSEASSWRVRASYLLAPLRVLDPLRGKEFLFEEKVLKHSYEDLHPLVSAENIVQRDLEDVRNCQAVLVNFLGARQVSIGTCVEIGYAKALGKEVVTVLDQSNPHNHPFITQTSRVFESLEDACSYLKASLLSSARKEG